MFPVDVVISGKNLESHGLVGIADATSPIGVITFGFLFACPDIWSDSSDIVASTVWTECNNDGSGLEYCAGD